MSTFPRLFLAIFLLGAGCDSESEPAEEASGCAGAKCDAFDEESPSNVIIRVDGAPYFACADTGDLCELCSNAETHNRQLSFPSWGGLNTPTRVVTFDHDAQIVEIETLDNRLIAPAERGIRIHGIHVSNIVEQMIFAGVQVQVREVNTGEWQVIGNPQQLFREVSLNGETGEVNGVAVQCNGIECGEKAAMETSFVPFDRGTLLEYRVLFTPQWDSEDIYPSEYELEFVVE